MYVYSVDSDSPLRKVGIKGGEIITEIKGLSIVDEYTLKTYCNALFAKESNVGINFFGISLDTVEEFEVEVSLDGTVASKISRNTLITNTPGSGKSNTKTEAVTTTTEAPVSNVPKYNYQIPNIIKIDTFLISEYNYEIKIHLDYIDEDINTYDGIENIKHCAVELLIPPYFDSQYHPSNKFGQYKRDNNCYSERVSSNEVIITYIFNINPASFSWNNLVYEEIPIYKIALYPEFNVDDPRTHKFGLLIYFGLGADCGEYPDCPENITYRDEGN